MKPKRPPFLLVVALVVVPALLVAAAYAYWFGAPLRRTVAETEAQIAEVERRLPTREDLQRVDTRAAELRKALAEIVASRQPIPTAVGGAPFVPGPHRAEWRMHVTEALLRHRLVLLAEQRNSQALPANIARGLTGGAAPGAQLSTWHLELRGAYPDVLAAIGELRTAKLPFHLLDIRMKRDGQGAITWQLVVA